MLKPRQCLHLTKLTRRTLGRIRGCCVVPRLAGLLLLHLMRPILVYSTWLELPPWLKTVLAQTQRNACLRSDFEHPPAIRGTKHLNP
jgi:hypothetical protein